MSHHAIPELNRFAFLSDQPGQGLAELLAHVVDVDVKVRADAAEALGYLGDLEGVKALRVLLKDRAKEVRIQAALGLIRLGEEGLFLHVLSALKHPMRRIVVGAALTLGRLADRRATPDLVEAFKTTDKEVGAAVAWALGQCGDAYALPWLMAAVDHNFVPAKACEALGKIGDEQAHPALERALSSSNEEVRAYAAKALSSLCFIQGKNVLPALASQLERLLQDTSRKVRLCASLALHRLGRGT